MWPTIFNLEAFWFWTLIIVQSGLVIWFVSQDHLVAAVLGILSILAGIGFFPGQWESIGLGNLRTVGFSAFVRSHYGEIIAVAGSYLIIGAGWAGVRWWLHARGIRQSYERRRDDWLHPHALLNTATFFRNQALVATSADSQQRYSRWSKACAEAAARGGKILTSELKPIWKEFVEHGYRF